MAAKIEKRVHLSEEHARRLADLACSRRVSEDDLVERALEILFSLSDEQRPEAERRGWSALSEQSLARIWDNDDDARYDNWRGLYGAPSR